MSNPSIHLSNMAPQVSPWAHRSPDLTLLECDKGTLRPSTCRLELPAKGVTMRPLDDGALTLRQTSPVGE
jgi:hypothetical protein